MYLISFLSRNHLCQKSKTAEIGQGCLLGVDRQEERDNSLTIRMSIPKSMRSG